MSRALFGPGVRGAIVEQIQDALRSVGVNPGPTDGRYGDGTAAAVRQFQGNKQLPVTGLVDDSTWNALTNSPIPPLESRVLQLTAAFEGHGFGLAIGNADGAWLTWGIIGFKMKFGKVQAILRSIDSSKPQLIDQAFGTNTAKLRQVLNSPEDAQLAWANSITLPGGGLAELWRTNFRTLGSFPEVQQAQIAIAHSDYFLPALKTASKYRLASELGIALCFDIQVQNGGISNAAAAAVTQALQAAPASDEQTKRIAIANAVADCAIPKFQENVRRRKLTIATGNGVVNGAAFALNQWGLLDVAAAAAGL
jgi:Putative peptidoglycan-binding domain-containing protein